MNLYRIYQMVNNGYDTYDSAVVCAESADAARNMHPRGGSYDPNALAFEYVWGEWDPTWAPSPEDVTVELIGMAVPGSAPCVICASYNAG